MKPRTAHFFSNIFVYCPKRGKIIGLKNHHFLTRLFLPFFGLASLVWFLVRVIPKPSRASYPCMKVAAPMASSFIVYLIGFSSSVFAIRKARVLFHKNKYALMIVFAIIGLMGTLWMNTGTSMPAFAAYLLEDQPANEPIGTAKGIFPGRVVWVHNPDATNENCKPTTYGDGWFLDKNNDQAVIDRMLSDAIQSLTGESTDKAAWDAIFKYHNNNRGKGEVGYQAGEIVFIKINATSAWSGNFNTSDLSVARNKYYGTAETSPQLVYSVLHQLVDVVGVKQSDIYIGDPMKHIYKHSFDKWSVDFPEVNYLDHDYGTSRNRVQSEPSDEPLIFYSDRGQVMHVGTWNDPTAGDPTENDHLYTVNQFAEYMINIPTLKGHKRAGVTMFAKNHFGSHTRDSAQHLHGGLVNPTENDPYRQLRNIYRVQVDMMGHKLLGGKTLMFLMDALFAGSEAVDPPRKFQMAPFNDDWVSSIFLSQDPLAIESVGYDFLRTEFSLDSQYPYPSMGGVDDYLHQAADPSEWPEGIEYDPEDDGAPIGSLGVHEHWNNATDKQYTRNLGGGEGIELVRIEGTTSVADDPHASGVDNFVLYQNYPNPFNPTTTIRYEIERPSYVELAIFNIAGQRVATLVDNDLTNGVHSNTWNGKFDNGSPAPSGSYIYRLSVNDGIKYSEQNRQMVLLK